LGGVGSTLAAARSEASGWTDIMHSTDVPMDAMIHDGTDATIVQFLLIEMLTV
jgi:hypothetical protein